MSKHPYCWQPLNIKNLQQHHPTRPCRFCGNPLHLLALNENIVFFIHKGADAEACSYIAWNTSYLQGLKHLMDKKTAKLNAQIPTETPKS